MSFLFTHLEIPDVILIEAKAFGDERGFFAEMYKRSEFVKNESMETLHQSRFH